MMAAITWYRTSLLLLIAALSVLIFDPGAGRAQSKLSEGYAAADARYTPSERAGREIWFYATAFNHRFFTYSYPQRLGAAIDWYEVLNARDRDRRFETWGVISDPDCCTPGDPNCPAQSLDETYGFEWCPGDEVLLSFVGKPGYEAHDPACAMEDAPFDTTTPHGDTDQRQSTCDLYFGTSTGGLGLRKFPNPRFDSEAWVALNGSASSWDAYRTLMSDDPKDADSRNTRVFDAAVEPPFMIGMACGACHIAFDPVNPPKDVDNPKWENLMGLVGNQYSRISEILASALSRSSLEWQLVARARPGTVDTSALPMDFVSNPGTQNAIMNFAQRPVHEHAFTAWRRSASCPAKADEGSCWCEPGRKGKCWERKGVTEKVRNVLKGGEDSIGLKQATQRVYFNIGSCAEQCWLNHIPDIRAFDTTQRNHGQTPFDIGQCRRDCGAFRAIEDRLENMVDFLLTGRPNDLAEAKGKEDLRDLVVELEQDYGEGAFERGRQIFARQCARCHSSQDGPFENVDFHATDPDDPTLRIDWLGNDQPELASEIGTHHGRALHSNHVASRVWAEFGSETLRARPADPGRKEITKGGGRGYYRNISLLSAWAHAPFMQNNAIGPELCGQKESGPDQYYSSPYVADDLKTPLPQGQAPDCWPYDPSVNGRVALFKASLDLLLNPAKRVPKVTILDRDLTFDIAPEIKLGDIEVGLSVKAPKGVPVTRLNNLRLMDLVQDLALYHTDREKLAAKYQGRLDEAETKALMAGLKDMRSRILKNPGHYIANIQDKVDEKLLRFYSNSLTVQENAGHRFGESLSDQEQQDLIAFLLTL